MLKAISLGAALTIILISIQTGLRANASVPNQLAQQPSATEVVADASNKLSLLIAGSIVLFLAKNQLGARTRTSGRQISIKPQSKKLSRLCAYDQQVASRLLSHAKKRNPGQSEQWYVDKVIYDLERDRR